MSTDDDIATALPKPPPPAPAPREATIEAALRVFDGGEAAPLASARNEQVKRSTRWWTPLGRPQTGVLVSAALVALIGLPVAWVSLGPQTGVESESRPASAVYLPESRSPTSMADAKAPPPPAVAQPKSSPQGRVPPPAIVSSNVAPAEALPAPSMAAPPPPPPPPPPMVVVAGKAEPARDRLENAPVQMARVSNRQSATTNAPAPSPAAPSPAFAVAPSAFADADASSIVVTGARKSPARGVGRGDWNACTVNDPRQRLAACKRLVDPAAKGATGLAAARIADGLTQAWQGNLSDAIGAFDRAIATDPRSALAHLNRGLAYANNGDLDRAIADLDQAVRYAPRAARGYYNRSLLLRQRGDIRRARADEERAVDLDSSYSDVVK